MWNITTREQVAKRIQALRGSGRAVRFCTNRMLGRGTVWTCKLDEAGRAVIVSTCQWWGMEYSPADESRAGQVLGEVVPVEVSGSLDYTLGISGTGWTEGRG